MICPCCGREGLAPLIWPPGKHVNLKTGAWPIEEWGFATVRGWVSDPRFGPGQPVIKRTNRAQQRARQGDKSGG